MRRTTGTTTGNGNGNGTDRGTGARTSARRLGALVSVAALALVAGCSSVTYEQTPLPVAATPRPTSPASPTTAPACDNARQSYDPLPSAPRLTNASSTSDATMRRIVERGYLTVGVSADTYLFGARDPFTGKLEGFDIDMARAVAQAMFGDPGKISFRVITANDRLPLLEDKQVDMVVRNMSMTCDRWTKIAFSAEYYRSGQKVLVGKNVPDAAGLTLAGLKGRRVCAPTGTTSLTKLQSVLGSADVVTAPNHTGCLVLLQQGKADAITGDDTVLAGLAAQDPNTVITSAKAITTEPYGIGFNKDDVYLARYVNRVIADLEADGRWKTIYDRWLATPLGPAPAPPTPVYGR
ncbi:glutamate ABC transporter substrate-binding protein [Terrabacter sp. NPDC000476]|uniref:glutamate ABC transporter substrate-binding protein n=1 Tax=Terrabacter sp. NPDC000476 TaxID=3154258 RepID=UPI00331686B3